MSPSHLTFVWAGSREGDLGMSLAQSLRTQSSDHVDSKFLILGALYTPADIQGHFCLPVKLRCNVIITD